MTDAAPDPTTMVWVAIPSGITTTDRMAELWLQKAQRHGYPHAELIDTATVGAVGIDGHMYVARAKLGRIPRIVVCRFGDNTQPEHKDTSVGGSTRIIDTTGASAPRLPHSELKTREIQARRPTLVFDRDPFAGEEGEEKALDKIFSSFRQN